MASRVFIDNFETVTRYYRLKELGEFEEVRRLAREDMENAEPSYALMAAEIREEQGLSTRCVDIPRKIKGNEAMKQLKDMLKQNPDKMANRKL